MHISILAIITITFHNRSPAATYEHPHNVHVYVPTYMNISFSIIRLVIPYYELVLK